MHPLLSCLSASHAHSAQAEPLSLPQKYHASRPEGLPWILFPSAWNSSSTCWLLLSRHKTKEPSAWSCDLLTTQGTYQPSWSFCLYDLSSLLDCKLRVGTSPTLTPLHMLRKDWRNAWTRFLTTYCIDSLVNQLFYSLLKLLRIWYKSWRWEMRPENKINNIFSVTSFSIPEISPPSLHHCVLVC